MKPLTPEQFKATFETPMTRLGSDAEPQFDFWSYFEALPAEAFEGYDCRNGTVTYVYRTASGRYEHVLVNSNDKNVFMVVILDLRGNTVHGHRLLNLNKEYELD
jgi:hypothetical protein